MEASHSDAVTADVSRPSPSVQKDREVRLFPRQHMEASHPDAVTADVSSRSYVSPCL